MKGNYAGRVYRSSLRKHEELCVKIDNRCQRHPVDDSVPDKGVLRPLSQPKPNPPVMVLPSADPPPPPKLFLRRMADLAMPAFDEVHMGCRRQRRIRPVRWLD